MKILILGATGMIGSSLYRYLCNKHEVFYTVRCSMEHLEYLSGAEEIFNLDYAHCEMDVVQYENLTEILKIVEPSVVVNATGVVKQIASETSASKMIELNALFPHRLAELCFEQGVRVIQFSTDCVFSGLKGDYRESDFCDALDLYGRSKRLGEVDLENCLNIRTSTIGLELQYRHGLVEWFLSQKDEIDGYTKAIYTGITTKELAKIVDLMLREHKNLNGLLHVSGDKISKFDLLSVLQSYLPKPHVRIKKETDFVCDRSLVSDRFLDLTGYKAPSWQEMLLELSQEIVTRDNEN